MGHVDFMLFVSISFALVSQLKFSFQWNMGLSDRVIFLKHDMRYWVPLHLGPLREAGGLGLNHSGH